VQSKSQTDGLPDRHNSCLAEIHQLSLARVIALMAAADSSSNGSGKDQSLERAAVEVNGRMVTLKWEIYRENSSRKANSFAVQLHPVFFRFQTTVFHSHLRTVLFTKRAQADVKKRAIAAPKLQKKAKALLNLLASDPFQQPHPRKPSWVMCVGPSPCGPTSTIGWSTRWFPKSEL
jgi:hypothetical protein